MIERAVDVGGATIWHREAGEGRPMLFLHGFPQTGHCWRGMVDRLGDRFRLLMPDVPGFGKSDAPAEHDPGVVAAMLVSYLDEVDASEAIVVGHDWGGAFAFRMALDHPARVPRLVVTNTAFRELSPLHSWYIWLFNIPLLPEAAFRFGGDHIVSLFLKGTAAADRRSVFEGEPLRIYQEAYRDPARVSSVLGYYRTVTRKAFAKQMGARLGRGVVTSDALSGGRFGRGPAASDAVTGGRLGRGSAASDAVTGGRARRIEMPTLIVWGMRDPALPPKLLRGMKRDIPQAEIVELPGCGHFVPEECPDALAAAIKTFTP